MENQPIEQGVQQSAPQPVMPAPKEVSSVNIGFIGGAALLVIIALGIAYFIMNPTSGSNTTADVVSQTESTLPTAGNTTADISAELNQIPDTSASLDADAASSESDIQNL